MIKLNGTTILATRGDVGSILIKLKEGQTFKTGQTVSLIVVKKYGYTEQPVLAKSVTVAEETNNVLIPIEEQDTRFEEIQNKYQDYWYNIVVDDNKTLLGSDEQGEKIFRIFPEPKEEETNE